MTVPLSQDRHALFTRGSGVVVCGLVFDVVLLGCSWSRTGVRSPPEGGGVTSTGRSLIGVVFALAERVRE